MNKIQMIIEQDGKITGLTCKDLIIEQPTLDMWHKVPETYASREFRFIASNVIQDNSPRLISIPDELLLRIRDYNIDVEHQYAIKQTRELKEQIEYLKDQVRGWELRCDLAEEEYEKYNRVILGMIDRYPMAAAEIALQNGDLDAACYFAKKANEECEEDES